MASHSVGNALHLLLGITYIHCMNVIEKAVHVANGPSALAKALGIKPPSVVQWLKGVRPVPAGRCIAIEQATGGQVTRYELRPDVFGQPPQISTSLHASNNADMGMNPPAHAANHRRAHQ